MRLPRAIPIACLLLLPACHLSEAVDEATTPDASGRTPAIQIVEQIPNIIANPANPFPWIEILGTVGLLVVTAVTGKRYLSTRAAAKANSTTAMMARIGLDPEVIAELVAQGIEAMKAANKADPPAPPEVQPTGEPEAK